MTDSKDNNQILGEHGGVYIPADAKTSGKVEVEIDFGGFIVGLYQSALMSMGRLPIPGEELPVDLESAKHTIDIIKMLAEKTKGNLEDEEDRLLSGLLHELRLAYIEATR
jgi:hypothetical protein